MVVFTNSPAELSSVQFSLTPDLEVSSFGSTFSEEVQHPTMSCSAECECSHSGMPESLSGVQEGRECASPICGELCGWHSSGPCTVPEKSTARSSIFLQSQT